MEIKDGRVTPTSQKEADIFSRLLREQELANGRQPADATAVQQDQELPGGDSYKIFCAAERRINSSLAGPEEAQVIGGLILGLASDHLDRLDLGNMPIDFCLPDKEVDHDRISAALRLASQALTNRYE